MSLVNMTVHNNRSYSLEYMNHKDMKCRMNYSCMMNHTNHNYMMNHMSRTYMTGRRYSKQNHQKIEQKLQTH